VIPGNRLNPPQVNRGKNSEWKFLDLQDLKGLGILEKRMDYFKQKRQAKVFQFVASRRGEGVSTILTNLSEFIIKKIRDKNILLIDANFSNPVLHTFFGIPLEPGLFDLLSGEATENEVIKNAQDGRLSVVTSGNPREKAVGGLLEENLSKILDKAKEHFGYILIDSPPLLESPDALYLATASDITFLVIQAMRTRKEVAEKSKALLMDNECEIGGVLMNRVIQVIPEWLYRFF